MRRNIVAQFLTNQMLKDKIKKKNKKTNLSPPKLACEIHNMSIILE
jgi:hypothetical protein